MRNALAVLLWLAGSVAPSRAADPDFGLRMALGQSRDALNAAFTARSAFPGQVSDAYAGFENQEEAASKYLARGRDLRESLGIVAAQLDAAAGQLPGTAAAIRRRAQDARAMAQLYLTLPRDAARAGEDPEVQDLYVQAMSRIAFDGDYAAAEALRIRAVETSRRPVRRR